MGDIDSYFCKFPNLPDPAELRERKQGVIAIAKGPPGAFTITTLQPLPEDAPQYAFIGKIAVEWANLEAAIDRQIWDLCGTNHNLIACLTAQMIGPSPRLSALIAICKEKKLDKKLIENLGEFKRHAQGVAEQRNRFVHDSWHVEVNGLRDRKVRKNTVTAKDGLRRIQEEVSDAAFKRIIFKIRKLNDIFELVICSDIRVQIGENF